MNAPSKRAYDNRSEPGFSSVRKKRLLIVCANAFFFIGLLAIIWYLFGVPAFSKGDPVRIAVWLAGSAFPVVVLVWGVVMELQRPLDFRIEPDCICIAQRRRLPAAELRGSTLEETTSWIRLRRPGGQSNRSWFLIHKRDLANPEHFVAALRAMLAS